MTDKVSTTKEDATMARPKGFGPLFKWFTSMAAALIILTGLTGVALMIAAPSGATVPQRVSASPNKTDCVHYGTTGDDVIKLTDSNNNASTPPDEHDQIEAIVQKAGYKITSMGGELSQIDANGVVTDGGPWSGSGSDTDQNYGPAPEGKYLKSGEICATKKGASSSPTTTAPTSPSSTPTTTAPTSPSSSPTVSTPVGSVTVSNGGAPNPDPSVSSGTGGGSGGHHSGGSSGSGSGSSGSSGSGGSNSGSQANTCGPGTGVQCANPGGSISVSTMFSVGEIIAGSAGIALVVLLLGLVAAYYVRNDGFRVTPNVA